MGNPFHSGERQRSEAAEQIIATRTESAFQVSWKSKGAIL